MAEHVSVDGQQLQSEHKVREHAHEENAQRDGTDALLLGRRRAEKNEEEQSGGQAAPDVEAVPEAAVVCVRIVSTGQVGYESEQEKQADEPDGEVEAAENEARAVGQQ